MGRNLWDVPQFISLYRQEVSIGFLLRFFHQQQVNCELCQYSHMFIKVRHLSKSAAFSYLCGTTFFDDKTDLLMCLILVSVSCLAFSNCRLFWMPGQLNIYMNLCPQNLSDSAQHAQGVALVRCRFKTANLLLRRSHPFC